MPQEPRDSLSRVRSDLTDLADKVRACCSRSMQDIETLLLQRGHRVHSANPQQLILLPSRSSVKDIDSFYRKMHRYSFRLLLRDIVVRGDGFSKNDVCKYASDEVTQNDLDFLLQIGLLTQECGKYKSTLPGITSFGETLEWYVSSVFEREFRFASSWSVLLGGEAGIGDYDVLASAGGKLVYIETKSSPPRNIHEPQVSEFIARTKRLAPDMAVFFVDTELRLEDKILEVFRSVISRNVARQLKPAAKSQSVYVTSAGLCIVNSRRDIIANLRECVKGLFRVEWRI